LLISSVFTLGPAKRVKSIPSDSGKLGGSAYNHCYVWRGVIEGSAQELQYNHVT
jgi:hypothetical protein